MERKYPYRRFMRADELDQLEAIDTECEGLDRQRKALTKARGRIVAKAIQRARNAEVFPSARVGSRCGPFHVDQTNTSLENEGIAP